MNNIHYFEDLLSSTNAILNAESERAKLNGEKFNIFSILNVESSENSTHSAFLGELLNPKGTHLMGATFLKLFLEMIAKGREKKQIIDTQTTKVHLEYFIGKRDDVLKQGGRIDIFISDKEGNSLSIENKIYAGDQNAQIERYHNHNNAKNVVYYLTLLGTDPIKESRGDLVSGTHYFNISYKDHIIAWLQLCLNEVENMPILRETIKQYLILIKKLTYTMDNLSEKALLDVMLKYYEEASYIAVNFEKLQSAIGEHIREKVFFLLKERLSSDRYEVIKGNNSDYKYSQIWILLKGHGHIFFGIESFSGLGNFNGDLFIGIFDEKGGNKKYAQLNGYKTMGKWINPILLRDYERCTMNLRNTETAVKLQTDNEFKDKFILHIVSEIEKYLLEQTEPLLAFLNP